MTKRGVLAIVSSPSGAGKSTLTGKLLEEFGPRLQFSVSYTTRKPRVGEVEGRHYHFISPEKFQEMVEHHEFAEWAWVHNNRYGTAKAPVEAALAAGHDVIFDVDWYGGKNLAELWPDDVLKIFILPPSVESLRTRLQGRATDPPEVIEQRYRKAIDELEHFDEYQYLIVNDDLEHAYNVLRAIYLSRRDGTALPALPDARDHAKRLVGR